MLTNPVIAKINQEQLVTDRPAFKVGDTIAVVIRVIEGGKERLQTFQGVVIAIKKRGVHSSFIVRKISHGVGVERTFMLHSRAIQDIRVVRTGLVRQSKIYYMRERSGKSARIAERFDRKPEADTKAKTPKTAQGTDEVAPVNQTQPEQQPEEKTTATTAATATAAEQTAATDAAPKKAATQDESGDNPTAEQDAAAQTKESDAATTQAPAESKNNKQADETNATSAQGKNEDNPDSKPTS